MGESRREEVVRDMKRSCRKVSGETGERVKEDREVSKSNDYFSVWMLKSIVIGNKIKL